MNWSRLFGVSAVSLAMLFSAGCATTSSSSPSRTRYDADDPQTFISQAEVAQVKGVAMGSAVSKGWTVVPSSEDTLILQRPLSKAAAQSIAPEAAGPAPLPPLVQVRSSFFPRNGGVDVVLDAEVVTGRGTEKEKRQDFTESYRPELTRSLSALQSAWAESGWRVASATPPVTTAEPIPEGELDEVVPPAAADTTADASAPAPPAQPAARAPAPRVRSAWGTTPAPVITGAAPIEDRSPLPPARTARTAPTPVPPPAAPVEEATPTRSASPSPAPVTATAPASPTGPPAPSRATVDSSSNMLVLKKPINTGVWAYYAEHYARMRGCRVTDAGAQLVEKENYAETHRVACVDGKSFLVSCNAGVCRGLR